MSTKASTRAKRGKEGLCSLTGKNGKFVKAHILPRALTRISKDGEKIREAEIGGIPKRRPATWYDDELVIREGEDILEEIDTPGIETLRNHVLIWSSFNCDEPFPAEALYFFHAGVGMRGLSIDKTDVDSLRLFFISIVWRSAASSRPEFKHMRLEADELEDFRQRVLLRNPGDALEYPIILDQIITRGDDHNRTPILDDFSFPESEGRAPVSVPMVRIYMDGLVALVLLTKDKDIAQRCGAMCLGAQDKTSLMVHSFECSRTRDDMCEIILDNATRGYS